MYIMRFDGSCTPVNPGTHAGYGVIIYKDGRIVWSDKGIYHDGTVVSNNVGEYRALISGLNWFVENNLIDARIKVYGDSNLVVNQMSGRWKIKKGFYKEHALEAKSIISQFPNITLVWVPREQNEEADALSKGCSSQHLESLISF